VAALAVLGLGTLAAREAQATCGDYLYHAPMSGARSNHAARPDGVPARPAEHGCHGPGCRDGNPPIQLPQPAPVRTQRVDQYAMAVAELTHAEDADRVPVSESAALASRGHRSRIDRPPRG
jgi:hypothetical protein